MHESSALLPKLNDRMLDSWKKTALILCGFGLFKELRPSEPFFTEYLIDYKGISLDDIVHVAFPIWTYTYLGTLAVVFLVTDFLRYRVVIILEGVFYVITWILITWGQDLTALIIIEICYGIVCSTEVAYYTYIYAKVEKKHYQRVTSYTYSAIFAGKCLGGIFAQVLVSFEIMDYHQLNYVSLASVSIAVIFALFLPSVQESIYFHRKESRHDKDNNEIDVLADVPIESEKLPLKTKISKSARYLLSDFKEAYSSSYVLKWSFWWAVATSGHLQVINYIQALWETIVENDEGVDSQLYNGGVEAIHTLLSSILAFGVGHVSIDWSVWGEGFLGVVSLAQGGLLYWMSQTENLYVAYVSYILYRMMYQVVITIASAEVAKNIREDSYALIFGINTFAALAIQTILTLVVADEVGLALSEKKQFVVYGGYHAVLGLVFVVVVITTLFKKITAKSKEDSVE